MAVFGNNTQTNVRSVSETVSKEVVNLKLNNGTDSSGNVKLVSQSIGSLDFQAWDAQKVMNVAEALQPLLTKAIYDVTHIRTSSLRS